MEGESKNSRFNFVLDIELFEMLNDISARVKLSISDFIEGVWDECRYMIEKGEFTTENADDWMFNETGLSMDNKIRITINPEFKKQLFIIQSHFQLRSKAEILRHIIRKYFEKIKKMSVMKFRKVKERFDRMWVKLRNRQKEFPKRGQDMDTNLILYTYNTGFNIKNISYIAHGNDIKPIPNIT